MARLSRGLGVGLSGGFLVGFSPVAVMGLWGRGSGSEATAILKNAVRLNEEAGGGLLRCRMATQFMESLVNIDQVVERIRELGKSAKRFRIGIDGMAGIGKTTFAHKLADHLDVNVISLDDYLDSNRGAYTQHIRCDELTAAVNSMGGSLVIEGVCLRSVAARCNVDIDLHIYIRGIAQSGLWHDDEICMAECPPEELKEQARDLRKAASELLGQPVSDEELRNLQLEGELIDYHVEYDPVRRADILVDVIEQ